MDYLEQVFLGQANDRAERGAAWLDRVRPGWELAMFGRLDVGDDGMCVLGQLFGSFAAGLNPAASRDADWLVERGFLVAEEEQLSYSHLSEAWEALIYTRGARTFLLDAAESKVELVAA